MSGTPAPTVINEVLHYFKECATTEITEEKYFPSNINRDSTLRDICGAATKVLGISASVTMQSWELPCLFNGSGAGKTHINYFARSLVREYLIRHPGEFTTLRESFSHCFRIYLKQVNGLSYNTFCQNLGDHLEPSFPLYFKWFIASQLLLPQDDFKLHQPHISQFGLAMKALKAQGFLDKIEYSVVFAALRQKYNLAYDVPIWILVAHDEVQFLTSPKTLLSLKDDQDAKRATNLYKYIMEALKFAQTAKQYNIHVLNIYSGTFRLDVTTVLEATNHRWRNIPLEPLTVDDGVKLLSAKHPNLANKMNTPLFKQVLSHLGNIPRIWRIFSQVIERHDNPSLDETNLADMNEQLKNEVKETYGREEQFELLLLLAMQGWTMAEARRLLPPNSLAHVNELQHAGLLFMIDQRFYVPPILLRSLTINFQTNIKQILTYFPDRMLNGSFTPTDFEEFCIGFFTLKRNLLVSQGIHKIPLVEFFKGAWVSRLAEDVVLTLTTSDTIAQAVMYKTKTASLDSLATVKVGLGRILNATKEVPIALWIGNNDPHQDGILLLPETLIQLEMKYSIGDAQQALTGGSSSSFESEQKKAESSPLRLKGKTNIFVYITNCRMTSDIDKRNIVQHDGSIIICADVFCKVFSPTFEYVTSNIKNASFVPVADKEPTVENPEDQQTEAPRAYLDASAKDTDKAESATKKPEKAAPKKPAAVPKKPVAAPKKPAKPVSEKKTSTKLQPKQAPPPKESQPKRVSTKQGPAKKTSKKRKRDSDSEDQPKKKAKLGTK